MIAEGNILLLERHRSDTRQRPWARTSGVARAEGGARPGGFTALCWRCRPRQGLAGVDRYVIRWTASVEGNVAKSGGSYHKALIKDIGDINTERFGRTRG